MPLMRTRLFALTQSLTRQQKQGLIWLTDVAVPPLAFLMACLFTYNSLWPSVQLARLAPLFPALALAGGIASIIFGLHRTKLKTYEGFTSDGLFPFTASLGLTAVALTSVPGLSFPVVGTLAFALILFLAAVGLRMLLLRVFLWILRHGKPRARVLIYGAGTTGLQLCSALRTHDSISVVAFVDDDRNLHGQRLAGLRIYPSHRIEDVVANHDIARVIMAMPSISAPRQAKIGRRLQALGLEVQVLPSFAQLVGTEVLVDKLTPLSPGHFLGRDRLDATLPVGAAQYRDRSVLITGAGGSIGSELCRQILACAPRRLVLFEISELALYTIEKELRELFPEAATEIVTVLGSVTDARTCRQALADNAVEIVLHAAAYKHVPLVEANPLTGLTNNVLGTRTLADACVRQGVRLFLLVSTDKAVRPANVMGASKRLAELVVHDLASRGGSTLFSIVRFGNVLGSSGSVIPLFKEQIARGGPVTLTHEDVSRYFMTITEAARLVMLAGSFSDDQSKGRADVFVLDMGQPVRIRQLAEQMIHAAGYSVRDERNPEGDIEIRVIGLRPGEKLHEELLMGGDMLPTPHPKIMRVDETRQSQGSVAAMLQELGRLAALGDAEGARALALGYVIDRPAPVASPNAITAASWS